ncbi:MAG: hypothetical protein GF330_08070 [Candidatus Eisenbacteria bacterium]|nr:hypothetical protein [Candidatus Eisenbacteria bacterium]
MKRMVLWSTVVLALAMVMPTSASAGILVGEKGDMDLHLGAVLQAGFAFQMQDSVMTTTGLEPVVNDFWLRRVRMLLSGTIVPDRVEYLVQTEFNGAPAILDYKARFFYIPQTEICFGRFLPNYSLYMPVSTAKLELINYPVTTAKTAMWRETGIQTHTMTEYVDFSLGLFNGADVMSPNTRDNNDAKDYLVRADLKPPVGDAHLRVGGYFYANNYHGAGADIKEDDTFTDTHLGFFAKADYPLDEMMLKLRGELVMSTEESGDVDDPDETEMAGFFAQAGLRLNEQWEGILRYESWDPNTENDNDTIAGSEEDAHSAITVGINHYIDGTNAMIYLNFVQKMFQHEDVDSESSILGQVQIAL